MRRFIAPAPDWGAEGIRLSAELVRHLGTVLRLEIGAELVLIDGEGRCARCVLVALEKKTGEARILNKWTEADTALPVQLLQGVPKGEKMDWLLQKTTELGVQRLTPVQTERSIPSLKKDRAEKRLDRWRKVAAEAARQSQRATVPAVEDIQPLTQALSECCADLKLVLWEDESQPLAQIVPAAAPRSVAVLVGPEGGLSVQEVALAKRSGFTAVRLGPRILRTETAGVAILSVLQYLYGDLGTGTDDGLPGKNVSEHAKESE